MSKSQLSRKRRTTRKPEKLTAERTYVLRAIRAVPDFEIAREHSISVNLLRAKSHDWGIKRRRGVPPSAVKGRLDELRALLGSVPSKRQVEMLDAVNRFLRTEYEVNAYAAS